MNDWQCNIAHRKETRLIWDTVPIHRHMSAPSVLNFFTGAGAYPTGDSFYYGHGKLVPRGLSGHIAGVKFLGDNLEPLRVRGVFTLVKDNYDRFQAPLWLADATEMRLLHEIPIQSEDLCKIVLSLDAVPRILECKCVLQVEIAFPIER